MAEAHAHPNYMAIFWWLLGLTIAELAVAYMPLPKGVVVSGLVSLAVAKAVLVAMYFMHLKFERRTLAWIALTPPILLIMFLCITYPDTAWRLFIRH